jgi:hypothetical protein
MFWIVVLGIPTANTDEQQLSSNYKDVKALCTEHPLLMSAVTQVTWISSTLPFLLNWLNQH